MRPIEPKNILTYHKKHLTSKIPYLTVTVNVNEVLIFTLMNLGAG